MPVVLDFTTGTYRVEPDLRLQEVRADSLEPGVKSAAEAALRAAVADLHLPIDTRIVWCVEEGTSSRTLRSRYGSTPWLTTEVSEPARGVVKPAEPSVLWVVADQAPEAVAETVKHEARHSWQLQAEAGRWMLPGLETMAEREADAKAYAERPAPAIAPRAAPRPTGPHEGRRTFVGSPTAPRAAARPAAKLRPSAATRTRTVRNVTGAEAALAARRNRFFEHKGRRCARCEQCAEIVPISTTHRCKAALRRPW